MERQIFPFWRKGEDELQFCRGEEWEGAPFARGKGEKRYQLLAEGGREGGRIFAFGRTGEEGLIEKYVEEEEDTDREGGGRGVEKERRRIEKFKKEGREEGRRGKNRRKGKER